MNTQTHLLIAGALLCRRRIDGGTPLRNGAVVAGALLPDAGVYGLFLWSKLAGVPERDLWSRIYFSEPMQTVQAVLNSVPLYAVLLVAAAILLRPGEEANGSGFVARRSLPGLLALAALLHLAGDLPVHADDAHRHFWPVTDWRFHSPVSYWNPSQGGAWFVWVEGAIGIACAVALWRRFAARWVRALLALAVVAYLAVPLYFTLALGE